MRHCPACDKDLPEAAFYRRAGRGFQAYCTVCARRARREHYAAHRARTRAANEARDARYRADGQQFLWAYLLEHPCVDCGEDDPVVLEFDHVTGDKVAALSAMLGVFPVAALRAEVAKCEVRCARCHRRVTAIRGRHWMAVALGYA